MVNAYSTWYSYFRKFDKSARQYSVSCIHQSRRATKASHLVPRNLSHMLPTSGKGTMLHRYRMRTYRTYNLGKILVDRHTSGNLKRQYKNNKIMNYLE